MMNTLNSDNLDTAISIENVWKIFGDRAHEAFQAISKDGLTKTEVLWVSLVAENQPL
jgi:ABC-type proline/glycine betaine transport system ATPase subunit